MRRTLLLTLCIALLGAGLAAAPAWAELRALVVRAPDGGLLDVEVDLPAGAATPGAVALPGHAAPLPVVEDRGRVAPPASPAAPERRPTPRSRRPAGDGGPTLAERRRARRVREAAAAERERAEGARAADARRARARARAAAREAAAAATPVPGAQLDLLPVPNFVIRRFEVPIFLLPIYQAAGVEYGVRWEVLAAINEIETDYGRNLNVSSAGAVGWMQFLPSTWKLYGVDGNRDGRKDPYNPVDAIFAAGRYLRAAGAERDLRGAIWAYNHADWYVEDVLRRANGIAGIPSDLVGSLTGLTEGRFPVYARARYEGEAPAAAAADRVEAGTNAARVVEDDPTRDGMEIYSRAGAPVVATTDGVVRRIGTSRRWGRYVVLEDAYGNAYTYAGLGRVSRYHPVSREGAGDPRLEARALRARSRRAATPGARTLGAAHAGAAANAAGTAGRAGATRTAGAARAAGAARSAGATRTAGAGHSAGAGERRAARRRGTDSATQAGAAVKRRLFAHPRRPRARRAGGLEQIVSSRARVRGSVLYRSRSAPPLALDPDAFRLRRLRRGSRVMGGTLLGRIGPRVPGKAPHLYFEIRPAGRGAPRIDPKPILDGWQLLERTAVYRASGRNVLHGEEASIGQVLLLPTPLLERRVLADSRIEIYSCGRRDVAAGQIDRRVLAVLAYLAESGLHPTVSSLHCGHGYYTASGNVSHHSSGNAVDIAAINGVPILGNQETGGITERAVRRLMGLQGTLAADQLISLLDLGGSTLAMADHADHIHVGFAPGPGSGRAVGRAARRVLGPDQWHDLVERLGRIDNPSVRRRPSRFSLPAR